MNFYLILPDFKFDPYTNNFVPNQRCHYWHVYQSPGKDSYNIYEPRVGPFHEETVWIWPRKRISRKFIENKFRYQIFSGTVKGRNIEELLGKMNLNYLNYKYIIIE